MAELKVWKPGFADEDWKVEVCNRDIRRGKETLDFATYVVGGPLENFSGEQIAKALRGYVHSAKQSIKNGERK